MVSHNSNPEPNIPHQFMTSYSSMNSQPQLWNQNCVSSYTNSPDLAFISNAYQSPQISHTRHLMDLIGASNLSLSLNQTTAYPQGFVSPGQDCFNPAENAFSGAEYFATTIASSKFLRPAQALLEEVVSVGGEAIDSGNEKYIKRLSRDSKKGSFSLRSMMFAEFPNIDKYELHSKLMELIALLEGVETRYEQYYNQMQETVSSFEAIAGVGAGKCYTALALQAMSKHFCSLKEAILSQINSLMRKLSEEMPKSSQSDRAMRLQKMYLQQLGMIQNSRHSWRPIRGLPETSVAILRAWLFEHFLHPYPNDSEKLILASQTGLTKHQVSNWFINARVRLWKPMIEAMYKEEFADSSAETPSLGDSADE